MFKLPSIQSLANGAKNTFVRFPLVIIASIVAVFTLIYLNQLPGSERFREDKLWQLVMCSNLALTLFLAFSFFSESKGHSAIKKFLLQLIPLTFVTIYFFSLPAFKNFNVQEVARFILFVIGSHLLVSFASFITPGKINGFWQLNKSLFLRFLTSALYSAVLFIGLALALVAINQLFGIKIKDRIYGDLWYFIVGIFNTWFFLSGLPANINSLDEQVDYPKGLKIFTQYVLLPLVTIYLVILYAYMLKIAIEWHLPKGWVSYLVIGFSTAGIFSLLLIWPVRESEGNTWIKIYARWFYRALYPLIILLGLAIYKRVSQYGITENRYFILVLALWLAAIATYFLISKIKNIKVIPTSLCLIAFLSSFGPWGAFSVSERSQVNRLEKLLLEEKILVNGKIKKAEPELKGENAQQIAEIIDYLDEVHDFRILQPWFTQNLDSICKIEDTVLYSHRHTGTLLGLMGVHESDRTYNENYFSVSPQTPSSAVNVSGFDYYTDYTDNYYDENKIIFGNDSIIIKINKGRFIILQDNKELKNIDFVSYVHSLKKFSDDSSNNYYHVPNDKLILTLDTDSLKIQFNFTSIRGSFEEDNEIRFNSIEAGVLIKHK